MTRLYDETKKVISDLGHFLLRHVHQTVHDRQRYDDRELGETHTQEGVRISPPEPTPETRAEDAKNQYHNSLRKTFSDGPFVGEILLEIVKWENGM